MNESELLHREICRAFLLACCLEPLADKPGCTTRTIDSTPGTKLQYFTISAVNSVNALLPLIGRVADSNGQPAVIFDLALEAQLASTRSRSGGKVNYAQIFMLLPIITAQALLLVEANNPYEIPAILNRARMSMEMTSVADVKYLQKFVDLSRRQSEEHNRRIDKYRPQLHPDFAGYESVWEATGAAEFSQMNMAQEVRNGYPICSEIQSTYFSHPFEDLLEQSAAAYATLLPRVKRPDIAADCIVVAMYLSIVTGRDKILFS